MVDIQNIRELLELMVEHDLSEMKIRDGETLISLRKGPAGVPMGAAGPPLPVAPLPVPGTGAEPKPAEQDNLVPVSSPMVGTVYMTADPESPPFVAIGSDVEPNTTVCVIEAMKVFNEIRAEVTGTIERILVHNEQAVEYGQPLMLVRPKP